MRLGGQEWVIPIVHAPYDTLPKTFRTRMGKLVLEPVPGHADVVAESERFAEYVYNQAAVPVIDEIRFCCRLLALNYRVGMAEVLNALGLLHLNSSDVGEILSAAFGLPQIVAELEAQKKRQSYRPLADRPAMA